MLLGLKRRFAFHRVNKTFAGTKKWEQKRKVLNSIGHDLGKGTKVVAPIVLQGILHTGSDCYLNRGFSLYGLGEVFIGDNCDIAPDVTFLTGSHIIGDETRRAGDGTTKNITVGNGTWICARSTIVGGVKIGNGVVVAAGAVVTKDVPDNVLVGGVPAKIIRKFDE